MIFYSRNDVLFVSVHGDPLQEYPYFLGHADEKGEGPGEGFNFNYPLRCQSGTADWFAALDVGARIAGLGVPVLFVLEGGYAIDDIGANVVNVLTGAARTVD